MSRSFGTAESRRDEFEQNAVPHLNEIYRAALAMFGNPAEAQDLSQEVFFEAWRSFARFEPGTNCRAWLFKILMHKASHHRRKWFRRLKQSPLDEVVENQIEAVEPIPDGLTDEDVLKALGIVPESFREILLLADVQEFSYKEIAEIQQVPIGTVMSRLSRARSHLRKALGEIGITSSAGLGD